ncbi:MAG: hypothetical protein ABEH40_01280 [Haloferacaceae archaeon]
MPSPPADPTDRARSSAARGADPAARRLVGWTETRVEAPAGSAGGPGRPDEADYYVAVTVAEPTDPFLTVGRVPPLARLRRWVDARLGLGGRLVPDAYVPAPDPVERLVADRIAAGLDPAAVEARAAEERALIAAGRFDDDVAARNRAVPVGLAVVAAEDDGFAVGYGWFEAYR